MAAIDAVRGVALLGVLVVNAVTEFRVSIFQQFVPGAAAPAGLDRVVECVVSLAIESKAFCLFSLLFGAGLAMQLERLSASGRAHVLLVRRLSVLLILGLVHLLLIWNGDVLVEYALVGLVALGLLRLSTRALSAAVVALLALYVAQPLARVVSLPASAILASHVDAANRVYAGCSYAQCIEFSLHELQLLLPLHLMVIARTLALSCSEPFSGGCVPRWRVLDW